MSNLIIFNSIAKAPAQDCSFYFCLIKIKKIEFAITGNAKEKSTFSFTYVFDRNSCPRRNHSSDPSAVCIHQIFTFTSIIVENAKLQEFFLSSQYFARYSYYDYSTHILRFYDMWIAKTTCHS